VPVISFILGALISSAQTTSFSKEEIERLPALMNSGLIPGKDTFAYFSISDTTVSAYKLPAGYRKTAKWLKTEKARKDMPWGYYGMYGSAYSLKDALAALDTAKEFHNICVANSWCIDHYEEVFPHLVVRLGEKRKVGLVNSADLIIMDRLGTGDLEFYGHGGSVDEDLFTTAGRASWILNEITGEDFAEVHGNTSKEEIVTYKRFWFSYIQRLRIK
jgi:hypothetical protein